MIVVLALTNWMVYARVVRGIVLSVRQTPYVEAAEMIGCKPARVIFRHILPNLTSPLLTLGILEFTNIVLAEAAMSFLGLGVQPPATSWGLDIVNGKDYIFVAWWLITFPGLSISLTVLSINLFANWLRVTTDPQEREKRFARAQGRRAAPARYAGGRPRLRHDRYGHDQRCCRCWRSIGSASSSIRAVAWCMGCAASIFPSAAARRWRSSANPAPARA